MLPDQNYVDVMAPDVAAANYPAMQAGEAATHVVLRQGLGPADRLHPYWRNISSALWRLHMSGRFLLPEPVLPAKDLANYAGAANYGQDCLGCSSPTLSPLVEYLSTEDTLHSDIGLTG